MKLPSNSPVQFKGHIVTLSSFYFFNARVWKSILMYFYMFVYLFYTFL
jgi:hypothetical protein